MTHDNSFTLLKEMKPVNFITRTAVRIARLAHSSGFGVQSPSAYRFIRYVVNEHYPYYAYATMRQRHPRMQWHSRKLGELYLRLANFCQADYLVSLGDVDDILCEYLQHGCKTTKIVELDKEDTTGVPDRWHFIRVSKVCNVGEALLTIMAYKDSDTVLIIEDIKRNAAVRRLWQLCIASRAVSVSYDLYYCGIAFFDTRRNKQNYIVNF